MFHSHYGKDMDTIEFLLDLYNKRWEKICDFNVNFISKCCKYLSINTKLVRASELEVIGKRSELLVNICKKFGATEYISGPTAKVYLEDDKHMFEKEKINITYHDYHHPEYKQRGKKFMEKLSILDLLFNEQTEAQEYFK